ncbi:MAG: hypothetical protein AAF797_10725 [Planctomycetota bacterium]
MFNSLCKFAVVLSFLLAFIATLLTVFIDSKSVTSHIKAQGVPESKSSSLYTSFLNIENSGALSAQNIVISYHVLRAEYETELVEKIIVEDMVFDSQETPGFLSPGEIYGVSLDPLSEQLVLSSGRGLDSVEYADIAVSIDYTVGRTGLSKNKVFRVEAVRDIATEQLVWRFKSPHDLPILASAFN